MRGEVFHSAFKVIFELTFVFLSRLGEFVDLVFCGYFGTAFKKLFGAGGLMFFGKL